MDLERVFEALSNGVRRSIVKLLYDRVEMSYSELLNYLGLTTGVLNFHLRKLDGLIEKTERGTYKLSELGRLAYRLIREVEEYLRAPEAVESRVNGLTLDIMGRRVAAFLIDLALFLVATGILFEPTLWGTLSMAVSHLNSLLVGHPWVFHAEHLGMFIETLQATIAAYSHVFFAMFIFFTLLEAYKGRTPGKYVMGIRVVKRNGRRLDLVEAGIRNAGKVFLLPIDLALGVLFVKRGYVRYTDYYVDAVVERV